MKANTEIKYKIVDLRYNEVLDGKGFLIDCFGNPYDDVGGYEEPDRYKPIFYTGLKDKNGKEIYEGDIVSDGYENAVIIWDNNSASYLAQFNSEFEPQEIHQNAMWAEVIGNIYENKELIEKIKE